MVVVAPVMTNFSSVHWENFHNEHGVVLQKGRAATCVAKEWSKYEFQWYCVSVLSRQFLSIANVQRLQDLQKGFV